MEPDESTPDRSDPSVDIERVDELSRTSAHALALECLVAGIEAAHPANIVDTALSHESGQLEIRCVDERTSTYDLSAYDDVIVVGGGNAAGHLASALASLLEGRISHGAVVTDDPTDAGPIDVLPGDHPLPSQRGLESTRQVLEVTAQAGENDLVLVLVTGGGSALLPAPAEPVTLDDLTTLTGALLRSGATIDELNAVRKHCSVIKGGGLARVAAPATVVGLLVSDVVGDDLGVIASGPISPDPTTFEEATEILDRYGIDPPESVRMRFDSGVDGSIPETPTETDPVFDRTETHVLASGLTALEAARDVATDAGYDALILSARVRGESREAAKVHVAIAEECLETGTPAPPPAVLLSGGETTVTVRGDGIGGPNAEFALSAGLELADEGIVVASVDTDGIDGPTDAAGGIVDGSTVDSASHDGEGTLTAAEARDALERNDALTALETADSVVRTGPTGTNVNDLRVLVVDPSTDSR